MSTSFRGSKQDPECDTQNCFFAGAGPDAGAYTAPANFPKKTSAPKRVCLTNRTRGKLSNYVRPSCFPPIIEAFVAFLKQRIGLYLTKLTALLVVTGNITTDLFFFKHAGVQSVRRQLARSTAAPIMNLFVGLSALVGSRTTRHLVGENEGENCRCSVTARVPAVKRVEL